MSTQNPTRVVTGEVRLSYLHIVEPNSIQGGKPKYSVSLIIPEGGHCHHHRDREGHRRRDRGRYGQVRWEAPKQGRPEAAAA
ncbi:ssDNA-binding protein [Corynebacterium freneyi]|uniref:ssDNA-binding protein n=1 Tax=Corynebacterium freneyi TaxID=134034 RepID=UPI000B22DB10